MFIWNEDRIRWAKICNETNKLNIVKTNFIKDIIKNKIVLDAGCGLGYLSIEMSNYASRVISTDIDENALSVLKNNIEKKNIKNIDIVKADFYNTKFENVDYIIASFFSKPTADLKYMMSNSKKGVIIMTSTDIGAYELLNNKTYNKMEDAKILCKYLDEKNIKYKRYDIVEENGQYCENEEDADKFLTAFSKIYGEEKNKLIVKSKLKKTKIIDYIKFEYFISLMKQVSIIVIEK